MIWPFKKKDGSAEPIDPDAEALALHIFNSAQKLNNVFVKATGGTTKDSLKKIIDWIFEFSAHLSKKFKRNQSDFIWGSANPYNPASAFSKKGNRYYC